MLVHACVFLRVSLCLSKLLLYLSICLYRSCCAFLLSSVEATTTTINTINTINTNNKCLFSSHHFVCAPLFVSFCFSYLHFSTYDASRLAFGVKGKGLRDRSVRGVHRDPLP